MNFKQTIQALLFTSLIAGLPAVHAAEGVSFYYGAGVGGLKLKEETGVIGMDVGYGGEIFIGFEERGWAFEIARMGTLDTGTDNPDVDYKIASDIMSLSYRTVERNGMYYKFKYAKSDADFSVMDTTPLGATAKVTADDTAYGVGIGMRINREDRVELEYNLIKLSDTTIIDSAHMLNLRYIFGGSKP